MKSIENPRKGMGEAKSYGSDRRKRESWTLVGRM